MPSYYAVAKGVKTGVYDNWDDCKSMVNGYKGAVYKKFPSLSAAQQFVRSHKQKEEIVEERLATEEPKIQGQLLKFKPETHASSLKPQSHYISEMPKLYSDISRFYNRPSFFKSLGGSANTTHRIFVDGASRGNLRSKMTASGYGVFYGTNDPRNAAVGLHTLDDLNVFKPTNQRAELNAIKHALIDIANALNSAGGTNVDEKYVIYSDSQYAQNCVGKWLDTWFNNGWKSSLGKPVSNKDIIESCLPILNYINFTYGKNNLGVLEFQHVRGHRGNFGNEWADKLANIGADTMQRELNL
ncbi:uncharacterized protein PRCAT00002101001 [Priceomyces carsonii]|uniref:uncharacterized protein n=1 Tax=Priceomyces carsonii TaxID=28549 RepID=UPI002ED9DD24|nr:unnamed protein product [Priceomyces carsonii]